MLGQRGKGVIALILWIAGLSTCGVVSGLVALAAAVDGYMQSSRLAQGRGIGAWTFFGHG